MVSLKNKWIGLLIFIYEKTSINFKTQNFYRSDTQFYRIMKELIDAGWIEVKTVQEKGFCRKEYSLTFDGSVLVEFFFRRNPYFNKNYKKMMR